MIQLIGVQSLAIIFAGLILINAVAAICYRFNRKVVLVLNVIFYLLALMQIFTQLDHYQLVGKYIFSAEIIIPTVIIMSSMVILFFLKRGSRESINGPLIMVVLSVLSLMIINSFNILKIFIILMLFEILNLLLLTNDKKIERSLLIDLILNKLSSILFLSLAGVFIILSINSPHLLSSEVLNYNFYYMGICFYIIYVLSIIFFNAFENNMSQFILRSSNFEVACSLLGRSVIVSTVLIFTLNILMVKAEPYAQEIIRNIFKVVVVAGVFSCLMLSLSIRQRDKVIYYLFCMNNFVAFIFIFSDQLTNIFPVFIFFSLAASSFFVSIYGQRYGQYFLDKRSLVIVWLSYILSILALLFVPATIIINARFILTSEAFDFSMIVVLVILVGSFGIFWMPVIESVRMVVRNKDVGGGNFKIKFLENFALVYFSTKIIILSYVNLMIRFLQ